MRVTDPITSLIAATRAKKRVTVARAIETVLTAKGEPMTAAAILVHGSSRTRNRCGESPNPSHLWTLTGEA